MMPDIARKLVVVLDTTVAENAKFDFDGGSLGELQAEAEDGSLQIAITEVQVGEMRAHVKEQAEAIRSVAKALRAGAGKKRIASVDARENEGVGIPRLVRHPAVTDALDSVVAAAETVKDAFEVFLGKPYVVTIECGHVQASRLLPGYFGGRPPFGVGRKKDEFPDAISIEALYDFVLAQGEDVEVHVVTEDSDWHGALSKNVRLSVHQTVADVLQYLRKLDEVAELVEGALNGDPGLLGRVVSEEFLGQGFSLEEDWDASFDAMEVTAITFDDVTLVSLANRKASLRFAATVTFAATVDFTDYGSSAWDSEEGEYMFRDMYRVRIVHDAEVSGSAAVLLDVDTGQVAGVDAVSWDTKVFEVSFDSAESVEPVNAPDPGDYDGDEGEEGAAMREPERVLLDVALGDAKPKGGPSESGNEDGGGGPGADEPQANDAPT